MMSRGSKKSLRERQADVTRRAILTAARQLFADQGFANASVKSLAAAAGVAVQTIYTTYGSKAGVLKGLLDLIDEEAGVLDLAAEMGRTDDPYEAVALMARVRRQIRERCGDIIRILRSGAAADAEVAKAWTEGMRRRRGGLGVLTQRLQEHGVLKAGLAADTAADIAAALVVDEVCDVLVEQRGWSFDAYETWLRETMVALLCQSPTRPVRRRS